MNYREVKQFLIERDNFYISTHVNSDGDAIGSVLALARLIKGIGKTARVILHDKLIDPKYRFLEGFDRIESYRPSVHKKPALSVILLDSPGIPRIGGVASLIGEGACVLNIDHHASNTRFGNINIVDENACATAEILFRLAKALKLSIDMLTATQLYTGVMFDTGRFRYSHLDRAFPIATALVKLGAQPERVAEAVYGQKSYPSVKLLGEALTSLRLYSKNRVALMSLPFKAVQLSKDLDGIVDYAISITDVEVAGLLKEQEPCRYRISLRSRGKFDVNELARGFQGGGHPNAAGCYVEGDAARVKRVLLRAIQKRLS